MPPLSSTASCRRRSPRTSAAVGLDLLPGPGEIQTRCSCPDWAEPCKHSAAVCYLVADRLDEDPFDLFLLRGRSREALMAGVRSQRLGGVAPTSPVVDGADLTDGWPEDPGMSARLAWGRQVTAIPSLPAPPRRAGRPTVLATDPPEGSGIDPQALGVLATDAARRAWELVTGRQPETTSPSGSAERAVNGLSAASALDLSADEDCARLAAAALGEEGAAAGFELDVLARRAGIRTTELLRRGLAWRTGGREGLFVLHGTWQPGPELLRGGREALGPGTRASANRLTNGERQLRLGRDGCWYPYRKVRRSWEPDGDPIPRRALAALLSQSYEAGTRMTSSAVGSGISSPDSRMSARVGGNRLTDSTLNLFSVEARGGTTRQIRNIRSPGVTFVFDHHRIAGHRWPRMCVCIQMLKSVPPGSHRFAPPAIVTVPGSSGRTG